MTHSDKYENLYREGRDVCGEPFPEMVAFFNGYEKTSASVLDLGCGQGRDALMVAQLGHRVLGVDVSATGIQQMTDEARRLNLDIRGVVADITEFRISEGFDVVILDRVLHMLEPLAREAVLARALSYVMPDGFVLIADMPSNKPDLRSVFERDCAQWTPALDQAGFLFQRKAAECSNQLS